MKLARVRELAARAVSTRLRRAVFSTAVGLFLFYLLFFNHVCQSEVGIAWNRFTGSLWTQPGGLHLTWPWVSVSSVDTRPVRVCVASGGRGFSCKLVRFVPEAFREFVAAEGHRYYWWSNRISFNSGYPDENRGMKDVLRGYAYGASRYPFLEIVSEM